jgi:NADP-dependent 3-hydroxy acid dehydrogenase YdfG
MAGAAKPLALVTGVGPGTGAAIARRFSEGGYRVAMLACDADRLSTLEADIPDAIAMSCDVTDRAALEAVPSISDNQLAPVIGAFLRA